MPDPTTQLPGVNLFRTIREILALFKTERGLLAFVLVVNLMGAALTGVGDPISLKLLIDSISRTCSSRNLAICGPARSSTTISTQPA